LLNAGGDPAQAVPDPYGRVDATGKLTNNHTCEFDAAVFQPPADINAASLTKVNRFIMLQPRRLKGATIAVSRCDSTTHGANRSTRLPTAI